MKNKVRKYFILFLCCCIFTQTVRADVFGVVRDTIVKKATEKIVDTVYNRHPKLFITGAVVGIGGYAMYEYKDEIVDFAKNANEKITGRINVKDILQIQDIVNATTVTNTTNGTKPETSSID